MYVLTQELYRINKLEFMMEIQFKLSVSAIVIVTHVVGDIKTEGVDFIG